MDNKSWLWKKKSTEKATVAADKINDSLSRNEEEIQILLTDKAELESDLNILNQKLSFALSECNAKDDNAKKQEKMAQEATAGWEKAETEAVSLKQELDKALKQKATAEDRLVHLDAALKECMQQLRFVREEQEKRIHDAVMKVSREFEKMRIVLEEKLVETSKKLTKLDAESTQLSKALIVKEKVIQDLNEQRTRKDADFSALVTRLESIEKRNASLTYEVRLLEKELEIRNEEREFNSRTVDVTHKQHLDSVKKIAKLESECQRLRLLVRKRLPGPAAMAKMKTEVEMLRKDPAETRLRKSNPSPTGSVDVDVDIAPDTPSKRINFLTEQLCAMEEENRTLQGTLNKKTNELQLSRMMYTRSASRLSQVEAQLEETSKSYTALEPVRNLPAPQELSLASMSDMGSDDKVSCVESWASALISELEHFKNGKQTGTPSCKTVGALDINLMDDFVEMEKLAVSVDKPLGTSHHASGKGNETDDPSQTQSVGYPLQVAGRERVLASDRHSEVSVSNQEIQSENILTNKVPGWFEDILKLVLEQACVTRKHPDDILEDIKVALAHTNLQNPSDSVDVRESSNHPDAADTPRVRRYLSWKSPDKSSMSDSPGRVTSNHFSSTKKSSHSFPSNLSIPIGKIIELIEGISLPSPNDVNSEILSEKENNYFSYKSSEMPSYMVRVFQWKTSDLAAILQQFVQTCNDLLKGNIELGNFAEELSSALEWVIDHCFSLQDVSSMKDAIKKHFSWDESRSENEIGEMIDQFSEEDRLHVPKKKLSNLPIVSTLNGQNSLFKMEELQLNMKEESRRVIDESSNMESTKKDLEGRLQLEIGKTESLMIQLGESEKTIENLQTEVEILKQSKGRIEDQVKNHKMVNEDLVTQLSVAKIELNGVRENISSLEKELESKNNSCEELEALCLDLHLQLESVAKEENEKCDEQEENQLRTDWEIEAASEKLAECQETILNLGKQLKALASPRDEALFNKVISTPTDTVTTMTTPNQNIKRKSSLLDKMLAEDNVDNGAIDPLERFLNPVKHQEDEAIVGSRAIVSSKKRGGGGLLKKLFWRKKKGNKKKTPLLCAA